MNVAASPSIIPASSWARACAWILDHGVAVLVGLVVVPVADLVTGSTPFVDSPAFVWILLGALLGVHLVINAEVLHSTGRTVGMATLALRTVDGYRRDNPWAEGQLPRPRWFWLLRGLTSVPLGMVTSGWWRRDGSVAAHDRLFDTCVYRVGGPSFRGRDVPQRLVRYAEELLGTVGAAGSESRATLMLRRAYSAYALKVAAAWTDVLGFLAWLASKKGLSAALWTGAAALGVGSALYFTSPPPSPPHLAVSYGTIGAPGTYRAYVLEPDTGIMTVVEPDTVAGFTPVHLGAGRAAFVTGPVDDDAPYSERELVVFDRQNASRVSTIASPGIYCAGGARSGSNAVGLFYGESELTLRILDTNVAEPRWRVVATLDDGALRGCPDLSADGSEILLTSFAATGQPMSSIQVFDLSGTLVETLDLGRPVRTVNPSPDGQMLGVEFPRASGETTAVCMVNLNDLKTRLCVGASTMDEKIAAWDAGSQWLYFFASASGPDLDYDLYRVSRDASRIELVDDAVLSAEEREGVGTPLQYAVDMVPITKTEYTSTTDGS